MKANDLFLRKMNQDNPEEVWEVDGVGNCGQIAFVACVRVIEPRSINPGICIPNPSHTFGLRGLKNAIALIEAERAKLGLKTLE